LRPVTGGRSSHSASVSLSLSTGSPATGNILKGARPDFSNNLSASGPRISESCCAATTFRLFPENPDANRMYPEAV
jgi:hypothetical protein